MSDSTLEVQSIPRGVAVSPDCDCGACIAIWRESFPFVRVILCEDQVRRLYDMLGPVINKWEDDQ